MDPAADPLVRDLALTPAQVARIRAEIADLQTQISAEKAQYEARLAYLQGRLELLQLLEWYPAPRDARARDEGEVPNGQSAPGGPSEILDAKPDAHS